MKEAVGQAFLPAAADRNVCPTTPAAALIILDNVSEAELLSAGQLAQLPPRAGWLRLVATTRLGPERLAMSEGQLARVAVDSLDEDDALALIREHLPEQRFPSPAEEAAARELVRELGGFTLAVEQAAVHLGLNAADEPPSVFLRRLRAEGLPSVDDLPADADVAGQMLHQQKQLGPILRATLDPLTRELPAALTVLHFAALLPPDTVPWPWLKELAVRHHPELAERPALWGKLKRRLEGLRLLTGAEEPEVARLHRLVAAHLRKDVDEAKAEEVQRFAGKRAYRIYADQRSPEAWELDSLITVIPHLLKQREDRDLANDGMFLVEKVLVYRSLPAAQALLQSTHAMIQPLAASDPGNTAWQRDLSVSLTKLGDLAVAQGNLAEAQRLFADSLSIVQRLAKSDPGHPGWQRDLSVSLKKLGDLAVAQGNLAEAQRLFADSLRIAQRLAESDADNPQWQRDLFVSLHRLGNLAVAQGNIPERSAPVHRLPPHRPTPGRVRPRPPRLATRPVRIAAKARRTGGGQGNLAEAQRLFADSLRIAQRLAESDPGNAAWQRRLSESLNQLGDLAVAQGNLPEAQSLFADSLRLRATSGRVRPRQRRMATWPVRVAEQTG